MKKPITYFAITILGILAIVGLQQANSLNQELAVRDAIIDSLQKQVTDLSDSYVKMLNNYNETWVALNTEIARNRVLRENPVTIEIEKVVYLDRPVERVVIQYPVWQIFETIGDVPVASVAGLQPDICLWVAQTLQQSSLNDGYLVSIALAYDHYYYGKYVTDASDGHAGLLVETKQGWYFIDPVNWQITKLF